MRERFTSIRHPIAIDPGRGSLVVEDDYAAHVEQLMRQVLLTNPGERINLPDFGCGLRRMIFAPNNDVTANLIQVSILQGMEKWLTNLIKVDEVKVTAGDETLFVLIKYLLKARQERRYLNVTVGL